MITAAAVFLFEFKIISLTVKSAEFANADFSEDKFSFNELYIQSPILGFTKLSQLFRNLYIITFIANISNGDKMIISIIRTLLLYAFVIFAIRLMGKRQISDMQPSELVVTLIVSDIAAIPMSNTSQPLLSGIIPVLVLIACEIIASIIMLKNRKFRGLICGSPITVIEDGKLMQNEMKRLRMSTEDLCIQLRQQDIFSLDEVQYCIVETNGKISVLQKPEKRTVTLENLDIKIPDTKLETVVISDGQLLQNSLRLCKNSKETVDKILYKENVAIDDIFIMTLDGAGNYKIITKEN